MTSAQLKLLLKGVSLSKSASQPSTRERQHNLCSRGASPVASPRGHTFRVLSKEGNPPTSGAGSRLPTEATTKAFEDVSNHSPYIRSSANYASGAIRQLHIYSVLASQTEVSPYMGSNSHTSPVQQRAAVPAHFKPSARTA